MVRLAAAQDAMKIGTLIPLTGPLAEFGPNFRKAADLAAGHLKAAGLRLQLIHADDETSAIPAVRQLASSSMWTKYQPSSVPRPAVSPFR